MRLGENAAEVRVAARRLDEEGDVRAAGDGDLGAGDRAHAAVAGDAGELQRAVDPVVVGERERRVPELGGSDRELLRKRGAVEKRVRRVAVELDVPSRARAAPLDRRVGMRLVIRPVSEPRVLVSGERVLEVRDRAAACHDCVIGTLFLRSCDRHVTAFSVGSKVGGGPGCPDKIKLFA